jgi:hypothetical protein
MEQWLLRTCPLSPLFALFVVACLLKSINTLLCDCTATQLVTGDEGDDKFGGILQLFSFVDDISSCIYLPDFEFLCDQIKFYSHFH